MLAGIDTGTAGYTPFRVYLDDILSVPFDCNICACTAACAYALVTTYTIFVCTYQSHSIPPISIKKHLPVPYRYDTGNSSMIMIAFQSISVNNQGYFRHQTFFGI